MNALNQNAIRINSINGVRFKFSMGGFSVRENVHWGCFWKKNFYRDNMKNMFSFSNESIFQVEFSKIFQAELSLGNFTGDLSFR